jgi:hypothetical protein
METKTVKATVRKAYGQELSAYGVKENELEFEFSYVELQENDVIPDDEVLTPADILAAVNQKRYAAARAKAQSELFTAHKITKPGVLDTPEGQLAGMVKILVAAGNSPENALAMAKQVLGQ